MSTAANFPNDLPYGEVSFGLLKKITDQFSEVIDTPGALGTVYKGNMEGFGAIAVKKHVVNAPRTSNRTEYCEKVRKIMGHRHGNIANLLAFCHYKGTRTVRLDGRVRREEVVETLFCYEYFPNGNLHSHLFGNPASNFDWDTRFKLIKGICRGLLSLHTYSPEPIIHLNLKPQNILLDENMNPKITDFMYSRIFGKNHTRENTGSTLGSVGYKAPEYLHSAGEISRRTDIYALGLIILEIATREKNSPSIQQESARGYIDEVEKRWDDKNCKDSIMSQYPHLDPTGCDEVLACIVIGLRCVKLAQNDRPDVQEIVSFLNAE